jgi:hypothetical protein
MVTGGGEGRIQAEARGIRAAVARIWPATRETRSGGGSTLDPHGFEGFGDWENFWSVWSANAKRPDLSPTRGNRGPQTAADKVRGPHAASDQSANGLRA